MSANAIETLDELIERDCRPIITDAERKRGRDAVDAVKALLEAAKEAAHSHPGVEWGYDAAGIHMYEAGADSQGCPVCEALSRVESGQ